MRSTTSRLAAVGAATFLGVAVMAGPAGAATPATGHPEVFAASANATALQLKLAGQTLTSGISDVNGGSSLNVVAHAVGQLAPAAVTAEQKVSLTGTNQSQQKPQECGTPPLPQLPAPFPQLTADLACSTVSATTADGLPNADALGKVAAIDLNAQALFTQVLQPIETPIQQILGALPAQLDPATATVSDLLQRLQNTRTLGIRIGDSTSSLTTTASQVVSTASAAGGVVTILGLDGNPLATITVGSAQTKAVYDRATGTATPTFDPALVTVSINPPQASGLPSQTLKVAPGQNLTILNGTPLQSTITVAGGSVAKNADGSVTATSSGVELNLLQGLGASGPTAYDGGVDLALAKTRSSIGGTDRKSVV